MLSVEQKRERQRLASARWRARNLEKARAYARQWHSTRPGYNNERSKEWLKNPKNREKQHRANRIVAYRRDYDLSLEEYEKKFTEQNGVCAICKKAETRPRHYLHVDHDHETEKNRGLLCGPCNRALGLLQDNPDLFIAAAEYLKKYSDVS